MNEIDAFLRKCRAESRKELGIDKKNANRARKRPKMSLETVALIKRDLKTCSQAVTARRYGVPYQTVSSIARGVFHKKVEAAK